MISRLHYITQDHTLRSHQDLALAACEGGADWVQLRIKNKDQDDIRNIAKDVLKICRTFDARLIINDHVDIAKELELDGVHLGKEDMSPAAAREILGDKKIIGGTANTWSGVLKLESMQVDYIGLGPFRYTSTKDKLSPVLGTEGYKSIISMCVKYDITIPVIAIGGITEEDISSLMETGIYGLAVAGAINFNKVPQAAVERFLNKINSAIDTHSTT